MSESSAEQAKTEAKRSPLEVLEELFQPFNKSDAPGLVVGIAQGEKTLYRKAFGLASVELGVANTPWTRMRIGSTSKHFTSLAALLLAEEGKLDLDAGVRTYLPELPALRGEPTLRQLMSHTGGYRCYLDVGFIADGMTIKPKGEAFAAQVRQQDVNFAPGESMIYNNGGYHLLSMVVERVSGTLFENFLTERIFTPLGMIDTESIPSDLMISRGLAALHVPLPDGSIRRGLLPSEDVRGEGAMASTVDDMLIWLAHLRGTKTVGSEKTWQQMTTPARLNNGTVSYYALGLMVHSYRGVQVIHHAGGVIGGSCQMLTVPAHGLDIIIMTNGAPANPVELAYKVVDLLIGDEVLSEPHAKASAERFKPMVGTRYLDRDTGQLLAFADVKGELGLAVNNFVPIVLRDEESTLRLGFEDIAAGPYSMDVSQLATEGAPPASLRVLDGGGEHRMVLLPPTPPKAVEVGQRLVGRYQVPDAAATACVFLEGEVLKMDVFGQWGVSQMTLEALADDAFGATKPGYFFPFGAVFTVDQQEGRVTALRFSSLRTRQVRFGRAGGGE